MNSNIQQQQNVITTTNVVRTSTTLNQSGAIRNSSQPQPQRSSTIQNAQYAQPEIKQSKLLSFGLLLVSVGLCIFFYSITNKFEDYEECKKLYVSAEINEWVWYYNIFIQFYYLILVFGANKWDCFKFQADLPGIYKFINTIVLICILGMTIALQICLNYQEKCGNLTDQVRGYLAVAYIILVIMIIYLAFAGRKKETSSGAIQNPNQSTIYNENQRLNDQSQAGYSTFNNP